MLTLVRDIRTETAVQGRLYLNGACVCYTLENAAKAVPVGLYAVQNSKSPKFGRELPLVFSSTVKATRGIRIHRGNTAGDSAGCILVGMGRDTGNGTLTESAVAENMVTGLCRTAAELVIVEGF